MNTKEIKMSNVSVNQKGIVEHYDISNASETLHLAQDLAKFIRENRLAMQIQGKDYVNVEGWQYAGARLGILPTIKSNERIVTSDDEMKYKAEVVLVNIKTDQIVGSGFAICSNRESGKRYYQEFAIASMSQTRAIGKAYRNILAWIIRAAGYEPTPAEEMDFLVRSDEAPATKAPATKAPAKTKPVQTPEPTPAPTQAPQLASVKQKTELLLLLNNRHVTNDEKTKMIENINTFDSERIQKAIEKVKKVIEERDNLAAQAEELATDEQIAFAFQLLNSSAFTDEERRDARNHFASKTKLEASKAIDAMQKKVNANNKKKKEVQHGA